MENKTLGLDADHLSVEAQILVDYYYKLTKGDVVDLVGEMVLSREQAKQESDEKMVKTYDEVLVWVVPEIVSQAARHD